MTKKERISVAIAVIAMTMLGETAQAGWGSRGGSYGSYGSSGGSSGYASSGGSYGSYGSGGSYGRYAATYSSTGYGSSGASYGSSGASYGSTGASSGGSSGHVGLMARLRAHRAARASSGGGSYGSSGGGASQGSSGGSYGSYKVYQTRSYGSGGSSGNRYSGGSRGSVSYSVAPSYAAPSHGGSTGGSSIHYHAAPVQSAPIYHQHSAPLDSSIHGESIMETPVIDNGSYHETRSDAKLDEALLTMQVPAEVSVYVNGNRTRSTGTNRQFVSRGLEPGKSYSYEIRIVGDVDGRRFSETKTVRLRGGESRRLAYSAPANSRSIAQQPVETVLTVNVPADAKVILAGNATSAEGTSRTFRTKQLKPGEVWNNYVVAVKAQRNGKTVTQQKTITLVAGQEPELTFDFADATLAMR